MSLSNSNKLLISLAWRREWDSNCVPSTQSYSNRVSCRDGDEFRKLGTREYLILIMKCVFLNQLNHCS
jgi:hypothetical protein